MAISRLSSPRRLAALVAAVAALGVGPPVARAATPHVVSTQPASQAVGVPLDAAPVLVFDTALDPVTAVAANVVVTGSYRGRIPASVIWDAGAFALHVDPLDDFLPGERVRVSLTRDVTSVDGTPLPRGFSFEFSAWSAPSGEGEYLPAPGTWSIGGVAVNLAVVDLDADGLPEAIFSNTVPDSLTILTPDGAGGWSLMAQVPAAIPADGILPRQVSAGDLDGDGLVDLVVAASGPDSIQVIRNLGGGQLASPVGLPTGQTPYGVFVGDVDADGLPDLVTSNFNGHDISVLRNRGGGQFEPHVEYSAGPLADSPRWVDGADFDGDGDLDLAGANGYSYDVSIYVNDGDGHFTAQEPRPAVGEGPNFLEARDFDGDSLVDIVTVNALDGTISLLRGNGDATFQAAVHTPVGSSLPYGIQVADIDGDGDLDVVLPLRGINAWRVMENDGTGTFVAGPTYTAGNHCHTVGVADWDRDGDLDVLAGFAISKDAFQWLREAPPVVASTKPAPNTTGVALAGSVEIRFVGEVAGGTVVPEAFRVEGTQSGRHDVSIVWDGAIGRATLVPAEPFAPGEIVTVTVTADALASPAGLMFGGLSFEFLTAGGPARIEFGGTEIPLPGNDPVDVTAGDFDGDGRSDLAIANFLSNDVTLLGTASGFPPVVTGSVGVGIGPVALWAGDLDGDGHVDLACANLISGSVSRLVNDGTGGFTAAPELTAAGVPFALVGADFDRDGDDDLAVAELDPEGVRIWWNDGAGEFPQSEVLAVGGPPLDLAIADVDRDGRLDIVSVDSGNHRVEVFLRRETAFEAMGTYGTGNTPVSVFPWDTNGDGFIDLISADYGQGGISVLENIGGTSFAPAFVLPAADLPHGIWGADLTGDAELDLVTANSGAADLSVFRNLGDGEFDQAMSVPAGATPYAVVGGDWDGDGRIDLATVNRTGRSLTVLLNQGASGAPGPPLDGPVIGLLAAAPNPFREATRIRLSLDRRAPLDLRIFDVRGRTVATLASGVHGAGVHSFAWDGRNGDGDRVATGVYFVRMESGGQGWSQKILRVR